MWQEGCQFSVSSGDAATDVATGLDAGALDDRQPRLTLRARQGPIGGARAHRGGRRRACHGTELTRPAEGVRGPQRDRADPDSKSGDVIEEAGVGLGDAARVADLDPGHDRPDGGEGHGDAVVPVGVDRGRRAMAHPRVRPDRRASPPPRLPNGAARSRRPGSDRSRAHGRSPRRGSSCPREPVLPGPRPSEAGPAWLARSTCDACETRLGRSSRRPTRPSCELGLPWLQEARRSAPSG